MFRIITKQTKPNANVQLYPFTKREAATFVKTIGLLETKADGFIQRYSFYDGTCTYVSVQLWESKSAHNAFIKQHKAEIAAFKKNRDAYNALANIALINVEDDV